jgi:hypothetical protein
VSSIVTFSDTYFNERRPILIHGYAHVVPDGRDFPFLGLAGPWLQCVFAKKGYVSSTPQPKAELQANANVMKDLIDFFNDKTLPLVVAEVTNRFGNIIVPVDLRPAFSNDLTGDKYCQDWKDEMHASGDAFERAAGLIDAEIQKIPLP